MRRRFRGQVALEFMVLATAIFMVFGYVLYQAQLKYISFDRLADEKKMTAMGYELASAIETVCEPATPDMVQVKVPAAPYTRIHATAKVRNVQLLREGFWPARITDLSLNDRVIIESHDWFADLDTEAACEVGAGGTWNGADGVCELAERACLVAGGAWEGDPLDCTLAEDECRAAGGTWTEADNTCELARTGCGNGHGVWNNDLGGCDMTPVACRDAGGAWHDESGSCGIRIVSESGKCSSDYGDSEPMCGLQGTYMQAGEAGNLCVFFDGLDTQESCETMGGEWVEGDEPMCNIRVPCVAVGGEIVDLGDDGTVCNLPHRAVSQDRCGAGDPALVRDRAGRYRPGAGADGVDLCVFFADIGTEDACDVLIGTAGSWDAGTATCDVTDLCTDSGGEEVNGAGCHIAERAVSREVCERDDGGWVSEYDRIYLPKNPVLAAILSSDDCEDVDGAWNEEILTCGVDSDVVTFTVSGVHRFSIAGDPDVVPDDVLEVYVDTRDVDVHPLMFDPTSVLDLPVGGVIVFRNPDVTSASVVSEEYGCSNEVDTAESLCSLNGEWNDPQDDQGLPIDFCTLSDVGSQEECEVGPGSCTFIEETCKDIGGKWEELLGCVLTPTTCEDADGTWYSFTDSCEFTRDACGSASGTWTQDGYYHWHDEQGCIDNLRVTQDLCVIEEDENVMWAPVLSLDLEPDDVVEVPFPHPGTYKFRLGDDENVILTVSTVFSQVMLGAEQLNSPRELRRTSFVNRDEQVLTVVSDDGTCKTPTDVLTGDRSLWACTANGVWPADDPPRCIYPSLNSERLCTKGDGFWDPDANAGAGACYILSRLNQNTCETGGNADGWNARFKAPIGAGLSKSVLFPATEWGTGTEYQFYIGEEIFETIDLDIGQDSLVEVRREKGFKRFDAYDPLASSVVPITFMERTEPFDLVFKGMGTIGVRCQSLPITSGQSGQGMVVVSKIAGGAT